LIPSIWEKEFEVYVNISNFAIESVSSQKDKRDKNKPISFISRQLSAAEKNYLVTK
jgi:hypothetical protein